MKDIARIAAKTVILGTTALWAWAFIDHLLEYKRMAELNRKALHAREEARPELKQAAVCLQNALNRKAEIASQRPVENQKSLEFPDHARQAKEQFCLELAQCYPPVLRGNGMADKQIFQRAYSDCLDDDIEMAITSPGL